MTARTARAAASADSTPWAHPFLSSGNIARFRAYSDAVHAEAVALCQRRPRRLNVAFAVNMAQNMYKWARLARNYGADATLYLHPQDKTAISRPEWEEYDGEYPDVLDGAGFLAAAHGISAEVPVVEPSNDGSELLSAYERAPARPNWIAALRERLSLSAPGLAMKMLRDPQLAQLRARSPSVRHRPLLQFEGMYPYFRWAELLAAHDVTYVASSPFVAYASGKPYCIFSVGGDLQLDAGRGDDYGAAMRLAFASARFILASNPHTLGHCRRLGFTNAVYLPYPMDTGRYCPAPGRARQEWIDRFGGDVFVLTTSRIDKSVKGHSDDLFAAIAAVARSRENVRFVFLGWGAQAEELRRRILAMDLGRQLFVLPPVGKKRLLDYYRSSDIVLDQFIYGYYGATALEAAAVGKPVIMKLRTEHYAPLCAGDVAPVCNASTPAEVGAALVELIDSPQRRHDLGLRLREWVVRTHGEAQTMPALLALLQMAADRRRTPRRLDNPLHDALSVEELAYHQRCLQ